MNSMADQPIISMADNNHAKRSIESFTTASRHACTIFATQCSLWKLAGRPPAKLSEYYRYKPYNQFLRRRLCMRHAQTRASKTKRHNPLFRMQVEQVSQGCVSQYCDSDFIINLPDACIVTYLLVHISDLSRAGCIPGKTILGS